MLALSNKLTCYFFITGIFFFIRPIYCQDQKLADSLISVYNSGDFSNELEILLNISDNETNPNIALDFSEKLIIASRGESNTEYLHYGFLAKGNHQLNMGSNSEALSSYLESIKYAEQFDFARGIGEVTISIADVYSTMGNSITSHTYYEKGIDILRNLKKPSLADSISLGTALFNQGDEYFRTINYDRALRCFIEAKKIFKDVDYLIGSAYNIGNIGMIYAEQGKDDLALKNINQAMDILEEYEDYYAISEYLTTMSDIYVKQNDMEKALHYDKRSLDIAKKYGLKKQISDSNLSLSELFRELGDWEATYIHFNEHIIYRDSVRNLEVIEKMADQRTIHEVSQEQAKTSLSEQKRKNQRIVIWSTVGLTFLIGLLAYGLFRRNIFVQKTNKIIAKEKERSDNLLLNILPEDTAEELKEKGRVAAKKYDIVTVLFSDFKGFTSYAENLSPEELVQTIDYYFTHFDNIMEKYGLEKIKTIGDAYMAVGGLSFDDNDTQAKQMLLAAKDMNDFVKKAKNDTHTSATFDIRIGINTGPVVAGVVGTKKFAYDIWGDTVNIAARMESNSEAGKVNISENTYEIIKSDFDCEYRGELAVKNHGKMKMYFVNC
ncbi:adenylate/guanylate cyclase domain-containing protein [uncultured Winogradskyella sp.]|uniref:adenylate/guanylate cyclase domain-containing protein n=1 Tax=uncultured Winogradskyella sp. TaxID=395353 RepID=UPI00262C9F29|nr:adenylate/guanylate cyclase domain-containing protein [uncultured Winogradskyella sp.]